jgi:hypothetical protein
VPEAVEFLTPADLRDVLRGMAAVSLVCEGPAGFRDHWFLATGDTAIAQWGDFAGNRCHFLFHPTGSVILGFDHESPMSPHAIEGPDFRAWPGVYESLPTELMTAIQAKPFEPIEPELDLCEVTFCLWNQTDSDVWQKGDIEYPKRDFGDPDGQRYILRWLGRYAADFAGTFLETYKWELDEDAVAELLSGDEITRACLQHLKPGGDPDAVASELAAMGFRLI